MQHATYRRNTLALALAAALFIPLTAVAQNGPSAAAAASPKTLGTVTVLGSLIPRTEVAGAKPVMVVTGAQIKQRGFTTLWEFMESIPQAAQQPQPPGSWGSTSVNGRQLNLRGLGASRSLLLIDGHRVVDYPQPSSGTGNFQNYANIPTGMIDRIEILASGASSIYGSDAIAGVIDVILKHQYQGDDLKLTVGGASRGGRRYGNAMWTGGRSGANWHIVYDLEHTNREALWGRDRPYTDGVDDGGFGTWNPSARLFGYQYDQAGGTGISMTGLDGRYITPPANSCEGFPNFRRSESKTIGTTGNVVTGPITDKGTYCSQPRTFRNWTLTPGLRSNDGYVYGERDLGSNLQAYGSVGLWTTHGWTNTQVPGHGYGTPFYDQGTGQVISSWSRQFTQAEIGGQGNTYDNERYWNLRAGLKGTWLQNFDWDLNLGMQKYLVHEDYTGQANNAIDKFFMGNQLGTKTVDGVSYPVYNLDQQRFWFPISTDQYSTFGVNGTNKAASWMDSAQFNISNTSLFTLPWDDQPVGWAAVLQAEHNGFTLAPDPRGNSGDFSDPFGSYVTGGGNRMHYAGAMEFDVPLTSWLTWDLSGRFDKYNDHSAADIAKTWGTSLELRPYSGLLLRGSYGTNFKAPDMQAIYETQSVSLNGDYRDPLACIQAGQSVCNDFQHPESEFFNQYAGGNPNILPEKGHGYTYGLVWEIPGVQNLSLAADYWNMGINNAIQWIGLDQALTDEAGCLTGKQVGGAPYIAHVVGSAYCQQAIANVTRNAAGGITSVHVGPINEAQLYVTGVDASLHYFLPTDNLGNFRLQINYTDNLSFKSRINLSDPLLNTRYQQVRSRINWLASWDRGAWNATISGLRNGPIRANNFGGCEVLANGIIPSTGDAQCTPYYGMIRPWILWNASVGYRFNKRLRMTLDVHNLFDRVGQIPYYSGGLFFIPMLQGDTYEGREMFLTLDYKID